jgi:hypothetical protein
VKELQDKYQRDIRAKAAEIAAQKQAEKNHELMESTKAIIKDMVIPLLTALTGLFGAMAAPAPSGYGLDPAPLSDTCRDRHPASRWRASQDLRDR